MVPAATMAAYSPSKAALTAFVDCCRAQNRHKSTKIIELYPLVVQSRLFFPLTCSLLILARRVMEKNIH